jgi:hypothetical protein
MKILVENSTWNNVGDAWYQTSLYLLLKSIYPKHSVILGEGPIKRAFRINNPTQLKNSLDLMKYQKADVHVFSGPILYHILREYKDKIIEIKNRNAQYTLISVSGTGLSQTMVNEIGDFFKQYPPLFFASRDRETYEAFEPYVANAYDGICTAFLVNKTNPVDTFELEKPFFVSSFYTELEPLFDLIDKNKGCNIENIQVNHKKTYWKLPYRFTRHLNYLRPQQTEIGDYLIVRTIQNLNTKFNHINFALPNSFISFNPLSYLNVTKSSQFIISDRVHACAIGLAYNKPVRFLFNTPRAGIFDRMGFDYKLHNGFMYPNMERIEEEYDKLINAIKHNIF